MGGRGDDFIQLSQSVTASAGAEYYFQFHLDLSGSSAGGDYCSISAQTDSDTLFSYSVSSAELHGNFNGSGTLTQAVTSFTFYFSCDGSADVTVALDNVAFYTYVASTGTHPIVAQPTQILQNNQFTSGQSPWTFSQTTTRASFAVTNGQAVVTFGGISNTYTTPTYVEQTTPQMEATQTYTLTLDVYFNIPNGGANCLAQMIVGG